MLDCNCTVEPVAARAVPPGEGVWARCGTITNFCCDGTCAIPDPPVAVAGRCMEAVAAIVFAIVDDCGVCGREGAAAVRTIVLLLLLLVLTVMEVVTDGVELAADGPPDPVAPDEGDAERAFTTA
uniref:Uncharacterized protein n=1 Tax=Anopheles funestus TaxID=62324 RepID=A0A182S449_ANOFN